MRLAVVVLAFVVATACGPRANEAMRLLSDIAAGAGPSRLKETTPAPERRPVAYPGAAAGQQRHGDLYLSPEGPLAALVLVPGLARAGKDDPRLVAFADSLARVRFAVLVPDMAGLRALEVRPRDADEIADAVAWLADQPALARGPTVGVVAISYAAGPALIAAADPGVRERVGFVLAIGGYHDIERVVTFFTTGAFRVDGRWRHLEPNAYGKWVFVKSNSHRLSEPADRALLVAIAEARLDDLAAPIDDLAAELGPEGRAVLALATNTDRARVAALIGALPEAIRHDMAELDPSAADLESLAARLLLVHGRDDSIIPYSESVELARRLGKARASLYLADGLWHVDADFSLSDQLVLWQAAIELLELRDGG